VSDDFGGLDGFEDLEDFYTADPDLAIDFLEQLYDMDPGAAWDAIQEMTDDPAERHALYSAMLGS
jgi:hypothetical protein